MDGESKTNVFDQNILSPFKKLYLANLMKTQPSKVIEDVFGFEMFPAQREIFDKFYLNKYRRLFLVAGMRSGKSVLASMMAIYEFLLLLLLPNPQEYYGFIENDPIFISVVATSEEQANDTIFNRVKTTIENNKDFFSTYDIKIKDLSIYCRDKNITMKTLSSWSSTAVGRSNKAVIFDELSNFEETAGKRGAEEIYTRLSKSTDTFKDDGHIIAISSPKRPNDILMKLYRMGLDDPKTLSILKPTWEMNPNYTKEYLMNEHKFNMTAFYRDYACNPALSSIKLFDEIIPLNKNLPNILLNPDKVSDKIKAEPHVLAIDPAVKSDGFGVAVGYFDEGLRKIVVDGATTIKKDIDGERLRANDVKRFISQISKTISIDTFIYDTWMFIDLIDWAEDEGFIVEKHIVNRQDYELLKELMLSGNAIVVYDETLEYELENLEIVNEKKIDHPKGGSKDVSDAVANCVRYVAENSSQFINTINSENEKDEKIPKVGVVMI